MTKRGDGARAVTLLRRFCRPPSNSCLSSLHPLPPLAKATRLLAARRQASFASTCSTTSFPCKDGSQPLLRDLVVTGDRGRDGRGGSAGPQQRITQRRSSEYLDLIFIEKYCWGYLRIHMPGRALDGHTSPVERGRPSSLQIAFLEWGKLIVCTKN